MTYSPINFLKDFLSKNLKIKGVVVGYDYTYGYKKSGNIDFLIKNKYLFDSVYIVDQIKFKGEKISSSHIRELIEKIIHAKGLGKKMGFPTANLELIDNFVIPKHGVYDTNILIDGKKYKASTNIGTNPTVENNGVKIESHILNFNRDIYGKLVELEILNFVRPELKFNNVEELFEQIAKDVLITKNR